jgi:hypothetical protein
MAISSRYLLAILAIISTFPLVSAEEKPFTGTTGQAKASDVWTVPVSDGKTESIQVDYSVCSVDLSAYYDSLRRIFPDNFIEAEAAKEREQYQLRNLAITRIGEWMEYEVFDLTCTAAHHKSLMLKDAGGKLSAIRPEYHQSPAIHPKSWQ